MDLRPCYFVEDGLASSSPCTDRLRCTGCDGHGSYDHDHETLVLWRAYWDNEGCEHGGRLKPR